MRQRFHSLAVLAVLSALCGCKQQEPHQAQPAAPATSAPELPLAEQPMDRHALLLAVAESASDAARGDVDEAAQRALDGKLFAVRLRFGCADADDDGPSRSWNFDEARRVLSLRVESGITDNTAIVRALGGPEYEGVEGFWVRRPWMLDAACAAPVAGQPATHVPVEQVAPPSEVAAPAMPRIGIVQFFSTTDARTHRRDKRAYTATKVLPDGVRPSATGYDLIITGRLRRMTNGAVISCASSGSQAPPDCVVSAQFDSVSIVQPESGETLAKWSIG